MNGAQLFSGGRQQRKTLYFFHPTNTALNKVLNMLSDDLSKINIELLLNAGS